MSVMLETVCDRSGTVMIVWHVAGWVSVMLETVCSDDWRACDMAGWNQNMASENGQIQMMGRCLLVKDEKEVETWINYRNRNY